MHIESRTSRTLKKYYLAHTYRKNGKVLKVRIYLGANLSEKELMQKKADAETEIKQRIVSREGIGDPYVTVLSPSELDELRTLEAKGKVKIMHLSEEDWVKFSEAFTYDTNAIEGSSVDAKEVIEVLEKRKWPEDRSKEEIAETYGVAEAIKYIRRTKEHISLKLILALHRIVFRNSKHFAGNLRPKGVEVVVQDGHGNVVHRGAPSTEVRYRLEELVRWYEKNRKKYPPIVLAAVVHNQFENVHPFQDGNGRVGRLLLNNILLKHDLPPLNIELKNRRQYYAALQAYQNDHNLRPMLRLMLKEYRALKRIFKKR
ncbi:Fic/DOC family protein [Candidatus Gugararchaeum adminiculabundum]|nr:Fic/DOC family protein [Candidatus Gugararchaeum adminiculabundum]